MDYAIQDIKGLASTGFGRIVSKHLIEHPVLVPSFLKVGFEMVQRFNEGTRFEAINKTIHYQSFIEVMPVVDMEFAFNACEGTFPDQAKAMQAVVEKCKELYFNLQFPLNVAMEMRWIAYSDCLVCPAKAVQNEKKPGEDITDALRFVCGYKTNSSFYQFEYYFFFSLKNIVKTLSLDVDLHYLKWLVNKDLDNKMGK